MRKKNIHLAENSFINTGQIFIPDLERFWIVALWCFFVQYLSSYFVKTLSQFT